LEGLAEALFREAGDALFLIEPDTGQIIEVNPTAERLSGFSREQLLSMQTSWLLKAEGLEEHVGLLEAHRHTGLFHARDGFLMRTRDSDVWVPVNLTITRLHVKPRTLGLITARDQRAQRDAYLRAKKIETELRRVLTSVSDCLWSAKIDSSGRWVYRYFLPVAESITGRPARYFMDVPSESDELPWAKIVDPRDQARWGEAISAMKAGKSAQTIYRVLRPDGKPCWIRESVRVSYAGDSGSLMLDGVITDMTERKQHEEELREAKEAAEAASRSKSEFLARMSHEIRTPLSGVLGMAELAFAADGNTGQRRYLGVLRSSANSLLALVDDILDFSRIEAGRMKLVEAPFGLREVLDDTLGMLAIRAYQKGLELVCRVRSRVPDSLVGDAQRFRQVMVNLVNNAIKFTERGQIVVDVDLGDAECRERNSSDIPIHVTIADTGIGISADQHGAIFAAFAQVDASSTRKHGGAGLGLSIVEHLVGLMGGRIWVESQLGQGSTFHFTGRFRRGETVGELDKNRLGHLNGRRVLVINANAIGGRVIGEILAERGLQATVAANLNEAADLLRQAAEAGQSIDLILLDRDLIDSAPCRQCLGIGSDVPVVVLLNPTNLLGDSDACRQLNVGAYLTKPIRESALFTTVQDLLAPETGRKAQTPDSPTSTPGRSLRILVAEDNAINQLFACYLLQQNGHQAVVANGGLEALNLATKERFDAAVMDIEMPDMDGFATTAAIRRRERETGKHLPIIALTAHALPGFREQCMAAGMDAYLCKPVQARELLAALRELCAAETDEPAVAVVQS
jgi:PAS domain S-box-containing protein